MLDPQTSADIAERLANALDALPHGIARTRSAVEIELIKKGFTEDEVWPLTARPCRNWRRASLCGVTAELSSTGELAWTPRQIFIGVDTPFVER